MTEVRKVPVSAIVPIFNEASNLPRCLASIRWCDEIYVVDSGSTDGSQQIAESYGAKVVQFHYQPPWPKKKNWALDNLPLANEWVLLVDADEELPSGSRDEVADAISGAGVDPAERPSGYWINRRFMFMGKWLNHCYFPNWNLRLFRHKCGRFEQLSDFETNSGDNEVHEHVIVQGKTGKLHLVMAHFAFPSVAVFVEKHNRYSNWEAKVALSSRAQHSAKHLSHQSVSWKRSLRTVAMKLPCRPFLRFLYVYIIQKGFLDGWEGFYFSVLHGFYEFLIVSKIYELRRSRPE